MRDDDDNPIKICMKLIFQAAIEKDKDERLKLSYDLSQFLTKPEGIRNLFLTLIDFDPSSQRVTTHNQRFLAVANIIACLPKLCMPFSSYCDNISKQLKPLLTSDNSNYSCLASIILKSLLDVDKLDTTAIITDPICTPFEPSEPTEYSASSYKLDEAIIATHNLIVNLFPSEKFVRIFPNLFYCYIALCDSPSNLKKCLRTCISRILSDLDPGPATCLLEETILRRDDLCDVYKMLAGDEGISIELAEVACENEPKRRGKEAMSESFEVIKSATIDLIEDCTNESLILEFFFHFWSKIWTASSDMQRIQCASLIEPLLDDAITEDEKISRSRVNLFTIIISNSKRAIDLVARALMNYVELLRNTTANDEATRAHKLIDQSLNSCLTILEVLFVSLGTGQQTLLSQKILPILEQIIQLVKTDHRNALVEDLSSLINRLSSSTIDENVYTSSTQKEIDSITKNLNDDLVPVRVHALVRLKQLILANNKQIIEQIPYLYGVVESTLVDQESYVFLASINLIAEMCVRKTSDILPKLMELYSRRDLTVQQRLNVGEVLVRLTKQLNKTAPYYATQIMKILLNEATQEDDELLRMSRLTNIGELCRYLGDSLGKYFLDILTCVEQLINHSDSPIELKCAGIELLRTALMGVDESTIESIQLEMKSVYMLLKKLRYKTLDDKLCLLIDLTLDEIDRLAKDMLGMVLVQDKSQHRIVNQHLAKNIKVLSLLSDK